MCEFDELIHEDPVVDLSTEEMTTIDGEEPGPTFSQFVQEPIPGPDSVSVPEPNVLPNPVQESDPYNETGKTDEDNENELGSCDCRSECRYNTGHTYKYADYGYSG